MRNTLGEVGSWQVSKNEAEDESRDSSVIWVRITLLPTSSLQRSKLWLLEQNMRNV